MSCLCTLPSYPPDGPCISYESNISETSSDDDSVASADEYSACEYCCWVSLFEYLTTCGIV